MNKALLSFLCFFLLGSMISAQILTSSDSELVYEGEACFDNLLGSDFAITNASNNDLKFHWRVRAIDAPSDWTLHICDANNCYNNEWRSPADRPNEIDKGQTISIFSFKIISNSTVGVGDYNLTLFDENDENNVYLTIPVVITATACTSSVNELKAEDLSIFPNPATDVFKVSDNRIVNKVTIHNIVGKEVKSFENNASGTYDVSDLTNGMYLARLFNDQGEMLKVLRLSKR